MPDQPSSPETHTERLIDALLRGLFAIRVPLALGVLTLLVLTLSDQVLEVHRVLTQERAQNIFNVHWLLSLVSLVALSVVLWQMARQHAEYAAEDAPGEHVVPHPLCHWMLKWGPRLMAIFPLLGAALGIWLSRLPNLDGADTPQSLAGPLKIIAQLRKDFIVGSLIWRSSCSSL
jgi:cytochrome bd-type quinol oxidase subunit 2